MNARLVEQRIYGVAEYHTKHQAAFEKIDFPVSCVIHFLLSKSQPKIVENSVGGSMSDTENTLRVVFVW